MTKNMGLIDRGLRLLVAAGLVYAAFSVPAIADGALFWLALIVAAVFTLTSAVSFCPLYTLLGLKTSKANL